MPRPHLGVEHEKREPSTARGQHTRSPYSVASPKENASPHLRSHRSAQNAMVPSGETIGANPPSYATAMGRIRRNQQIVRLSGFPPPRSP